MFCFFNVARFQRCCEKGFRSAMKLAAWCGGYSEASLEDAYRKYCAEGGPNMAEAELEPVEEEILEGVNMRSAPEVEENECEKLLKTVQTETQFFDPGEDDAGPVCHDIPQSKDPAFDSAVDQDGNEIAEQ